MRTLEEEMLVDYLEEELEPAFKKDVELLLSHNEQQRHTLAKMKTIRSALKQTASVRVPDDEEYFDKLHDKIMAGVGTKRPTPVIWLRFQQPRFAAAMAAGLVAVFSGWSIFRHVLPSVSTVGPTVAVSVPNQGTDVGPEDLLVQTSAGHPAEFVASSLVMEDEGDLIMDLAARRMENLSDSEMKAVLHDLME